MIVISTIHPWATPNKILVNKLHRGFLTFKQEEGDLQWLEAKKKSYQNVRYALNFVGMKACHCFIQKLIREVNCK